MQGPAVDGNPSTNYFDGPCTSTADTPGSTDPWWKLTFALAVSISHIEVANRGGCCGDRLNGFDVYIDGVQCASNQQISSGATKIVQCTGSGTEFKIQLPGENRILALCEVKVYTSKYATTQLYSVVACHEASLPVTGNNFYYVPTILSSLILLVVFVHNGV